MSDIFIDGACHTPDSPAHTWADLLGGIDVHLERQGRVLAVVRFDGIELPAFRDATVAARPLNAIQRIDMESASPQALLGECLKDGALAAAELVNTASHLAGQFRRGEIVSAARSLATLAADLRSFVAFIGALRQWMGNDARLHIDGKSPDEQMPLVSAWVQSLIAAHTDADWLTVADILDYDLEPFLRAWSERLEASVSGASGA
jgi:hypothetical protein